MTDEPSAASESMRRFAAVPLSENGTSHEIWNRAVSSLPELDVSDWGRAVVVVAHPDDEVFGAGRLISSLEQRGVPVEVIIASRGEGAFEELDGDARERLARTREAESRRAAEVLGLPAPRLLGFPDGGLARYEQQIAAEVSGALAAADPPGHATGHAAVALLSHWQYDGHPDHEAVGRAARRACATVGALGRPVRLVSFPIWALHWDDPVDGLVPMSQGARISVDEVDVERAGEAARSFASQTAEWVDAVDASDGVEGVDADVAERRECRRRPPVLPGHVVDRFARRTEFVFAEPAPEHASDRASDPAPLHRGAVDSAAHLEGLYRRDEDPWRFETSPYEARKRRATLAALPLERYEFCFEPGCSIGVLTAQLATRASRVLAWDLVDRAVRGARDRVAALEAAGDIAAGSVRVEQGTLSSTGAETQLGPRGADLIVLSEVLYFIPHDELAPVLVALAERAAPGAHLVAVHWRHEVAGWPEGGAATHEVVHRTPGLQHLGRDDTDPDFLIDVWETARDPHRGKILPE